MYYFLSTHRGDSTEAAKLLYENLRPATTLSSQNASTHRLPNKPASRLGYEDNFIRYLKKQCNQFKRPMYLLKKPLVFLLMFLGISSLSIAQLSPARVVELLDSAKGDSTYTDVKAFTNNGIIYYEAYDLSANATKIYGYQPKTSTNKELHQIAFRSTYQSFFALGNKVYHGHNGNASYKFKVAEFDGLTKTNVYKPTFDLDKQGDFFVGNKRHAFFAGRNSAGYGVFSFNSKSGLSKLVKQRNSSWIYILATLGDTVVCREDNNLILGSTYNNTGTASSTRFNNAINNDQELFLLQSSFPERIYSMKKNDKSPTVFDSLPSDERFQTFEKIGDQLVLRSFNYQTRNFHFYLLEESKGKMIKFAQLKQEEFQNYDYRLHPMGQHHAVAFLNTGSIITYDLKKQDSIKNTPTDTLLDNKTLRYIPVNDRSKGELYYFVYNGITDKYFLCKLSNKGKDVEMISDGFDLRPGFRFTPQPLMFVNNEVHYFDSDEKTVSLNVFSEDIYKLKFHCFNDEDGDGVKDAGESTINDLGLDISGFMIDLQSGIDGVIETTLKMGDYTIKPQSPKGWTLTTDAKIELLEENKGSQSLTYNVGIKPKKSGMEIDGIVSNLPMRCGFNVWLRPKLINSGTKAFSGECRIEMDTLIKLDSTSFEYPPDSVLGNEYVWLYDNVPATHFKAVRIRFKAPGTEFRGTKLRFVTTYRGYGDSNDVVELVDTFKPEVNCSYDPNDKTVWPNREDLGNQTLHDEKLTYRIRFQNTGTDTAFNIVVEDTLSQHLDWTTFKLMDYSHKVETQFYDDGLVKFIFNDVLLPDSNVNEPESHGFVTYTIKAKPGLDEWTEIRNTAHIYFDFNPAIVTNTTKNAMVKEITYENVTKPGKANAIVVYPNPAKNRLNLVLDNELPAAITIVSSNGKQVLEDATVKNGQVNISSLQPGIYFISIVQDDKVHRASFVKR